MPDWTKVVTEPLGLAGFALFLVFGLLSRLKGKDERRWLPLFSGVLAFVALLGGLGIAFFRLSAILLFLLRSRILTQHLRFNPGISQPLAMQAL